jgi:hypothetical protein
MSRCSKPKGKNASQAVGASLPLARGSVELAELYRAKKTFLSHQATQTSRGAAFRLMNACNKLMLARVHREKN